MKLSILLTLSGVIATYRKVKLNFKKSKYLYSALFLLISIAGSIFFLSHKTESVYAKGNVEWVIIPNKPVGFGKGIFPGRVVWVNDPNVAKWDGITGNWWDENVTS